MARKRSQAKKSSRKPAQYTFWYFLWMVIKHIGLGVGYLFKYIGLGVYHFSKFLKKISLLVYQKNKQKKSEKKEQAQQEIPPSKTESGKIKHKPEAKSINVVKTIKGDYLKFWGMLYNADSLIGLVIGSRGSGKSAVALRILENLQGSKKNSYALGFSKEYLPKWIKVVDDINDVENDSFVVIDEGGILFSSRSSMSNSNKFLSELLFIARHKNLSIIFISQNSSNLEINTLRQADFLILKHPSLLQKDLERKIVADVYKEQAEHFEKYKENKGIGLIYSDIFYGFIESQLPSFWSEQVSKSFK